MAYNKTSHILNELRLPKAEAVKDNFILPNNSGDHAKGLKRDAPANDCDLVNKKYVDDIDSAKLANHPHQNVNTDQSPSFVAETLTDNLTIDADNKGVIFGDGQDSILKDDGSHLIADFDSANAGDRHFLIQADGTTQAGFSETTYGKCHLIVGSEAFTAPHSFYVGYGNVGICIAQRTSTSGTTPYPNMILSNNQTDATNKNIGWIIFINEGYTGGSEKRLAQIGCQTDGQTSDGRLIFRTFDTGVYHDLVMRHTGLLQCPNHVNIVTDNCYVRWGAAADCGIMYNGTDMIIDPNLIGSGIVKIGATANDTIDAGAYKVAGTAGASGTFTTADGKTVTVVKGIITSIV